MDYQTKKNYDDRNEAYRLVNQMLAVIQSENPYNSILKTHVESLYNIIDAEHLKLF